MSLKKEENCNKREVFKLQLAGKVDLVWKQISLVFVDRSCSYFGILIKTENRFFPENMKVIGASWDLRMARFRWTDAPIELRFRVIDRNPHFTQGKFFFRSIFLSDCWVFGKGVFWLFLRQKMEKVPIFWARSNRMSESYFVLKFQKHRTIFGSMGFFKVLFMGTDRFYVCMHLCMYISSCWFLSILVNNFFNCHQLFQL